jgi:hypothetical protein
VTKTPAKENGMALVTLTNPGGLDLAVLGNPGARRTKMRRRTYRRPARAISRRRNPTAFQKRMGAWNATRDAELKQSKAAKLKRSKAAKKAAATRKRRASAGTVTITGRRPTKKGSRKVATKTKRKSPKRVAAGKKAARTRKRRAAARRRNTRTGRTYKPHGPKRTVKIRRTRIRKPGSKKYGRKRAYAKRRGMGWTGKKGTRSYRAQVYTKGRKGSRKVYFTNPGGKMTLRSYTKGLTSAPGNVMASLRGRNMVKNSLFIGGGAIGTYLAGGFITAKISPMLARIPGAGQFLAGDMGKRLVGGLMPYTLGFVASRFVKGAEMRRALVTGGAVASIVSVIFPNAMDRLISRLGIGNVVPSGTEGFGAYQALAGHFGDSTMLAGYVQAPAYAGVQGYVEAPAYAGVGDDALGGYLDSSYMNSSYLAGV